MRLMLIVLAVLVAAAVLPAVAQAQTSVTLGPVVAGGDGYVRLYSASLSGMSFRPGGSTSLRLTTSVIVPDGGEALLGGYKSMSSGRNESGVPVLGKVPYLGRGFRNVGYSESLHSTTASVRVRVIRMADEEERQTGIRP
jgi:Flp pilus assembly secretin CpaC